MAVKGNWRKIKKHRSYNVYEASRSLRVCKATIRRWINQEGLEVIFDKQGKLILGPDLIDFLKQRTPKKQPCKLHECYCLKCRSPQSPAFNAVEFIPRSARKGMIRALCHKCSTVMHKAASHSQIEALGSILDVTVRQDDGTLSDSSTPPYNVNSQRNQKT